MICIIMHVLCTGNNCVAKDNFHLTMFEADNKGILFIYLFIVNNLLDAVNI